MLLLLFGLDEDEKRFDPEDGQIRTYKELEQLCEGEHDKEDIREYWEEWCQRLTVEDERGMHDVASDPFMTSPTQTDEDKYHTNSTYNPFLTGTFALFVNVQRDPFMTLPKGPAARGRWALNPAAALKAKLPQIPWRPQ
mmetsp:Transcript_78033/g.215790  ORF Transcript_78033/g.215790 Transcript_78033/m.215790 type:complete len:139 (-) Transcript_78033:121-537(-)